jgi:hypothetical protein
MLAERMRASLGQWLAVTRPILGHASTAALDATSSHARYELGGRAFAYHTGDYDARAASAYHAMSGVDDPIDVRPRA